ncbi:hypothetical protein SanaruYs_25210 [Chryseotalea sanaruensis]|uniref:Alpha/beta hydrolase n=2 Tax=Chryseotalea sanaruensis TaxID=2482724 RepID=A0A401UBM7_9BACT|nr:hypothetical protein SanaruYs_25210 [Chryseotalea sanaruensis]
MVISSCDLHQQKQNELIEPDVEAFQNTNLEMIKGEIVPIINGSYGDVDSGMYAEYYYPGNQTNLPLVVIAHADNDDNPNFGPSNYQALGTALAEQGSFVVSIDRRSLPNLDEGVIQMYDLLQTHLKYIYNVWNGEILNIGQSIINENQTPLIAHDVMLIGHSAGGRAFIFKGKSAVNDLSLQLKAIIGIAPTMHAGVLDFDIFDIPFFIIQGNSDADANECMHYGNTLTSPIDWKLAKVPVLENEKAAIHGGAERAYILLNVGEHWIQDLPTRTIEYCKAILSAFLKGDRSSFDNTFRYQIDNIDNSNILYWNNEDAMYFEANTGVLPAGSKFATIFADGINYEKIQSNLLLGSTLQTKSLHFSNVLKATLGLNAVEGNRLKFMLSEPTSNANYVRFNAGELFDFSTEDYNVEGINPRIRLIYSGNFKRPLTSDWMQMVSYSFRVNGLNCGKIQNAPIHPFSLAGCNPKRNIMQTYVIGLNEFTGGAIGADVIGIEFDFTNTLGSKRLVFDDLAFMN